MKYYKKWAFRLFIYVLVMNAVAAYLTVSYVDLFNDGSRFALNMLILNIASTICLIIGIVMIILCIKNKELNDIKTWVATIGLSFFFVVSVILSFMGN
jgi:hypothetical protein